MLNVAIIGAGAIAPAHVEGFLQFRDSARIVAVANRSLVRAQDLIQRYQLEAQAFTDYHDAIALADIVAICTPPGTHRGIAEAAFAQGAHVLVEKPMAPTLADCDAILAAATKSGKLLSVVAQIRFIDSINRTVRTMKSGDFGRILFSQVNSLWWRGASYHDLAWRGRWQSDGGGCTFSHAVHHIDLLLWIKGLPSEVTAIMGNLAHDNSEEEDLSMAMLRFPDGSLGQITSSLMHHGEPQLLNFQLEQLGVSIPFKVSANKQRSNGFPLVDEAMEKRFLAAYEGLPALSHEHHAGHIGDFIHAIETGGSPLVTGESGRAAVELITAIYESASTGTTIQLPLKKDDPFRTKEGMLPRLPRFNGKKRDIAAFDDMEITSFKEKF
jgi:UDP-N-acetyl-2-amino-2-deoxyglucuronate dehydrogenase